MTPDSLKAGISAYLDTIRLKAEEDWTQLDRVVVETGETFIGLLTRHSAKARKGKASGLEAELAELLSAYKNMSGIDNVEEA